MTVSECSNRMLGLRGVRGWSGGRAEEVERTILLVIRHVLAMAVAMFDGCDSAHGLLN